MAVAEDDFLIDVARLISHRGMTIAEFYEALGVDLENYRADPDHIVSELAGIFKGWETAPPK